MHKSAVLCHRPPCYALLIHGHWLLCPLILALSCWCNARVASTISNEQQQDCGVVGLTVWRGVPYHRSWSRHILSDSECLRVSAHKLLSIATIARELNIPESTLHYWKNRFNEYLPSVGKGRSKRFREDAVEVFREISEMLKLGHTTKDVKDELGRRFALNVDVTDQPRAMREDGVKASAGGFGGSPGASAGGPGYIDADPAPDPTAPVSAQHLPATHEQVMQVAATVGLEIAKVVGRKMDEAIHLTHGGGLKGLEERISQTSEHVATQSEILEMLQLENIELKEKLAEVLAGDVSSLSGDELADNSSYSALSEEFEAEKTRNAHLTQKMGILEAELIRLRKDRREMEKHLLDKIRSLKN